MDRSTEKRLAKAPYNWLRLSPLLTIFTLYLVIALEPGYVICSGIPGGCSYSTSSGISYILGVLISGLWHLILLQYYNNKDSEIVRNHGRQALIYAGIRTAIPLAATILDLLGGGGGILACLTIPVLMILWFTNSNAGLKQVEIDLPESETTKAETPTAYQPTEDASEDTLTEILESLQSTDDVTVLNAIAELEKFRNSNKEILIQLEHLADEHDNMDVRMDARITFNRLKGKKPSINLIAAEKSAINQKNQAPQEALNNILAGLTSEKLDERMQALEDLKNAKFGSEAIRLRLEIMALRDPNKSVRNEALGVLDLPTQRFVRSKSTSMPKYDRNLILSEIERLVKDNLLDAATAAVIRKRYDFDITPPPPAPKAVPAQVAAPSPKTQQPPAPKPAIKPAPVAAVPVKPKEPEGPRPTLLQTLLSETSIKIALYLGAFFVIASALILAVAVPETRLPILIISTMIFGSVAVAIRKRLPQPSFALFIVFSFLLPITANVIEDILVLSPALSAGYWILVSLLMAGIWAGSTWLYNSQLFSITAFISGVVAFYRIGDLFNAQAEFYTAMVGIAALAGLGGAWALKKWRDAKFALPLFISAQVLEFILLAASFSFFTLQWFDSSTNDLWNLVSVFTWGLAFVFFVLSNQLYPFPLFPWFAAATLFAIPWFIVSAFKLENLSSGIVFLVWGAMLAAASEVVHRTEKIRNYSLPILLVSMPIAVIALANAFLHNTTAGLLTALGATFVYSILQIVRPRGWLWTFALLNFITAYFAFFALPEITKIDIFAGYQLLGLSLLFLLPDLFLKNDFKANLHWRLPLRIFGSLFTLLNFVIFAPTSEKPLINTGFVFLVYAVFFTVYALRYSQALIGYIATTSLAISAIYFVNHFQPDLWVEALSVLSVLYFFGGFTLRKNEVRLPWRNMLESSGLVLGSLTSLVALISLPEYSGWFVAVIGTLFIIEMYNRRNSLFEIGVHGLFAIAGFLILRDFNVHEISWILMVIALLMLGLDMVFSRTYAPVRLLDLAAKAVGGILTFIASVLFLNLSAQNAAIGFGILTLFFTVYTFVQKNAVYGYIPAAYLPLTIFFILETLKLDIWPPVNTALAILYFLIGLGIRSKTSWSIMLRNSALGLGAIIALAVLVTAKETGGWYALIIGLLFAVEMILRRNDLFEIAPPIFFNIGAFLILRDFKIYEISYHFLAYSLFWLLSDLLSHFTFKSLGTKRGLGVIVKFIGGASAVIASIALFEEPAQTAAIGFSIHAVFFAIYALAYKNALLGYIPAAYLPLSIFFILETYKVDAWLPSITGLAILYFLFGLALRSKETWSFMLRNSALALGTIISFAALITFKETGGWYALIIGLLFSAEMYLRRNGLFEIGMPVLFNIGAFLILHDFNVDKLAYHLLAYSLVWLLTDLLAHLTFTDPRPLKWPVRAIGALLAIANYPTLYASGMTNDSSIAIIGFGIYTLLFLTISLLYRQPNLFYAFTLTLPLFDAFLFRGLGITKWIHPVIVIAVIYYAVGYLFRRTKRFNGWDQTLLFSGLGLGLIVSFASPILGGVDASIPVAAAATLWAIEAFARKNVWLGFPTNALYLLAYFIILFELNANEIQFFTMGAALLGLIQHYLLVRAGSKTGAFLTGMVSQLILLGTTYIEMINKNELIYLAALVFQSLTVLLYGLVVRSRSLVFFPLGFAILGGVTAVYSTLQSIGTIFLIGCTGIALLLLGILAVIIRERIAKLGERLSSWNA